MVKVKSRTRLPREIVAVLIASPPMTIGPARAQEATMSTPLPSAGLAGHRLQQVGLTTRDLQRAIAFYRDVLGLPFLFETNGMAFFDIDGIRLMIGENRKSGRQPCGSILYFDDPDSSETATKLEAHGVRFFGPPEVVQRTETQELVLREFSDPDGNVLALMGMVPRR
jgi:methylmalonyl-CoA/ethylmalonyl-CoA epimerase